MLAGATILQCCADIENPVVHAQDAHWVSMNAVILLKDAVGDKCKIRGIFNYFREDTSKAVTAGCYFILAMVCVLATPSCTCPSHHSCKGHGNPSA
jgi:hypothetical protein